MSGAFWATLMALGMVFPFMGDDFEGVSGRQAQDLAGLGGGGDLAAEILDDAAGLLDEGGVRGGERPAGEIDAVLEPDPDVTTGKVGQGDGREGD